MFEKSWDFLFPSFVSFHRFCEHFFLFAYSGETAVVSCVFLWYLRGEIRVPPARIDPVTHDWPVWPLCCFKAQPRYHAGLYHSGYRFKVQSLVNITRYLVSVFGKIFLWFLTYAPRLHREGRTIFVPDQLLTEVNRAVNLWAYCQNINELAKIMDYFFLLPLSTEESYSPF